MGRMSRLIAAFSLLGTAACVTDGPLAPQLSPGPLGQRLEAVSDTPRVPVKSVLLRGVSCSSCGAVEPTYIVDGRVMTGDQLGQLDPESIISIEIEGGLNEVMIRNPNVPGLVIIRTRAPR